MNDISLKNISAIESSFNQQMPPKPNLKRSGSASRAKPSAPKNASFDMKNLSKILANTHSTSSGGGGGGSSSGQVKNGLSTSTQSLAKSGARIPPFYPPGKTSKRSFADTNFAPTEGERVILFSTWTPLNDDSANQKLFEERKQLTVKWFETWNDSQRRVALEGILSSCKPKQMFYARDILNKISPVYHNDFTRVLPRVICLYIMSYLDPRSLSRCAQVCWYWKMLSESDQLWMPKCLRFGWNLNYIPSSFETGIWKQFYIENIKSLQYVHLKADTERSNLKGLANGTYGFSSYMNRSIRGKGYKSAGTLKHPPWKGNSFNPNHLYRFNYLDTKTADEEVNEKRAERLMKSLALESSVKSQHRQAQMIQQKQLQKQLQQKILNSSKKQEQLEQEQQDLQHLQIMEFLKRKESELDNLQNQQNQLQQTPTEQQQTPTSANNLRTITIAPAQTKLDDLIKKGELLNSQISMNKTDLSRLQTLNNQQESVLSDLMNTSSINSPSSTRSASASLKHQLMQHQKSSKSNNKPQPPTASTFLNTEAIKSNSNIWKQLDPDNNDDE